MNLLIRFTKETDTYSIMAHKFIFSVIHLDFVEWAELKAFFSAAKVQAI